MIKRFLQANLVWEIGQLALAVFLASLGLKAFLLPNGFLDGGVTGISILLSKLTGIEISIILPIISIPFFVIGWFTISRKTVIRSIISVLVLSLIIHFENFQSITDDKLLISIFGGLFLGAGIGLAIKNGSVLDGSEILGIFLNEKTGISIGLIIFWFNVVLFLLASLLFSIEVAMYSVLTYIITAKTIDLILEGFEDYVGLMIVTEKSKEMQIALLKNIGQGLTIYNGSKGYGSQGEKQDLKIIHTVVNRIDTKKAYRILHEVDKDAFVIEFDVNRVSGGVLRKYLTRSKQRELSPTLFRNNEIDI
ncbi:YitT family protein [Christiangramia sp. OXR-203]|uniref:YitT family protein n=1 Tax=Christiangramia sp. OXR-203 TaxID=3100176 RepID=UPI002AC8B4BA|nr:YitT family protein [Christiangramia sp. OXR-203]WPY99828.1 YitT family protein [Christiangramia sp. OXR-203]